MEGENYLPKSVPPVAPENAPGASEAGADFVAAEAEAAAEGQAGWVRWVVAWVGGVKG